MIPRLHDAHHFWRQGYQTFSGFIKARERPQTEGSEERVGETRERPQQQRRDWITRGSNQKKNNPKDSGATPRNKRNQPPRHPLRRRHPLHRATGLG
ncbi:hypothetical protein NC653_003909 [Populus alba x Populus x berolinensis]|uniref:Uncharacterized protein n=1 Tax=Populus alba x Populus x berolinensis TaxID=444605 RepID=A0AAD6RSP9_9ROSI|nr:hypothetical protein NC653_003909 [Populus alba x Populus x berolinensis]